MRLAATWPFVVFVMAVPQAQVRTDQNPVNGLGETVGVAPTVSEWKRDRANPYSRLFQPIGQPEIERRIGLPEAPDQEPIVKCGMTIIPADPTIDPGIEARLNTGSGAFTIRAVGPPICR
jgi:hypothetical protein